LTLTEGEVEVVRGFEEAFREFTAIAKRTGRATRVKDPTLKAIEATNAQQSVARLVLGRVFSTTRSTNNAAERAAARIRQLLEARWNQAVAESRGSIDAAAQQAYQKMTRGAQSQESVAKLIRRQLFDPIRKAAVDRIKADPELVGLLETEAGILVSSTEGGPSLYLRGLDHNERLVRIGLDFDHAETALSRAVRAAQESGDYRALMSIVNPDNLQLLTSRENRNVIETLRRYAGRF
jgi:hypothetical protein